MNTVDVETCSDVLKSENTCSDDNSENDSSFELPPLYQNVMADPQNQRDFPEYM